MQQKWEKPIEGPIITIADPVPDLYYVFRDDVNKLKDLSRIQIQQSQKILQIRMEHMHELEKLLE